jgi:hypothetical protein
MYRNVLVATDLLPTSAPALREGLRLARSEGATVSVLYVMEVWMVDRQWFTRVSKEDVAFHKDFLAREEEAVSREMRAHIDRARSDQPIDTVDTLVRQGRARTRRNRGRCGPARLRSDRDRDARPARHARVGCGTGGADRRNRRTLGAGRPRRAPGLKG